MFLLHLEFQLSQWHCMGLLHLMISTSAGQRTPTQPWDLHTTLHQKQDPVKCPQFCERYDHKFLLRNCDLKYPHCTNARWMYIIWHFPRWLPPSNLQFYYTFSQYYVVKMGQRIFLQCSLLVWQHTENNYTLPSSSTPNLGSLHYHYCQYYLTI